MTAHDDPPAYDRLRSRARWLGPIGAFFASVGLFAFVGGMLANDTGISIGGASGLASGFLLMLIADAVHPLLDIARAARAIQRDVEQRANREEN